MGKTVCLASLVAASVAMSLGLDEAREGVWQGLVLAGDIQVQSATLKEEIRVQRVKPNFRTWTTHNNWARGILTLIVLLQHREVVSPLPLSCTFVKVSFFPCQIIANHSYPSHSHPDDLFVAPVLRASIPAGGRHADPT